MTKLRRFVAVMTFVGLAAYISTSLHGQPGKKADSPATTPQILPATQVSHLAEASESRFNAPGILTYLPVQ